MSTVEERYPDNSGVVLALLFLILFVGVLDNQVILPILGLIARSFGRSVADLGGVVTAYAFAAAAMNLLFGPLSDYLGRRPILLVGLAGFFIAAGLLSITTSYLSFFVLRSSMGIFAGVLSTSVTAYVGDRFPYTVRGRAMGVIMASYFAALVLGVPLGALIADRWDWHWIFRGTALLALALAAGSAIVLPPPERNRNLTWDAREHLDRYRSFVTTRDKLAALLSGAFVSGATLALLTFVSPWLMSSFGLTASGVGLVFLLVGAAAIVASPLSGWAADRVGKRRLFVTSSIVGACLVAALPWAPGRRPVMVLLFAVALTIAFRQTSQQALVTELMPRLGRGSFIALRNCFSQVGIGVSVLLASPLFEKFGFKAVALMAAVQSILAAVLFFWVPEPDARRSGRG